MCGMREGGAVNRGTDRDELPHLLEASVRRPVLSQDKALTVLTNMQLDTFRCMMPQRETFALTYTRSTQQLRLLQKHETYRADWVLQTEKCLIFLINIYICTIPAF